MSNNKNRDLYALLHNVSIRMGRGPRQGLAVRPGQNKVLKTLANHGKDGTMPQQELLKLLDIRAGTLSELLSKLEKEGYVERSRNEQDTRTVDVSITERGHISVIESKLSEQERDEALFGKLSEDERSTLSHLLAKLLDIWDSEDPETQGQRRQRRWQEIQQAQDEEREVNALLEEAASKPL